MKNVLFIENTPKVGGANRMTELLMTNLRNTEYVPLLTCPTDGPMVDLSKKLNITTTILEYHQPTYKQPFRSIQNFFNWNSLLNSKSINIIHANGVQTGRTVAFAAHYNKIPFLCHVHFPIEPSFVEWVYKRLPNPIGFIYCYKGLLDEIGPIVKKNYPNIRQWVAQNGVDTDHFVPFDPENSIPRIGIIANFQPVKRHEDFFEMAKIIKSAGVTAKYDIIGSDLQELGRKPILEQYVKTLGLSDDVCFHGRVENVAPLLQQLDIVVCTSEIEGLPLGIIEAMACGKPIISTNVNGIPEVVQNGINGFLFKPKSVSEFAGAAIELIRNKKLMSTMGLNGRNLAESCFSKKVYVKSIIEIYNEINKINKTEISNR